MISQFLLKILLIKEHPNLIAEDKLCQALGLYKIIRNQLQTFISNYFHQKRFLKDLKRNVWHEGI